MDDLLSCTVRPNKTQITQAIYDGKVTRWRSCWPQLTIEAWDCHDDKPRAFDETTLQFYSREAASYVANTRDGVIRWLDGFMKLLPAGARVLELGCGSGRDTEILLAGGFEVDPTDGSPAMAAEAQKRLKRPVRVMRFDELADIGVYEGVWAHASLLHVPDPALGPVLTLVFQALEPGGLFFANFKTGSAAGRDHLDRYYNYPDPQSLIKTYSSSAPWEILSSIEYAGTSYGGAATPWIAITARKPAQRS